MSSSDDDIGGAATPAAAARAAAPGQRGLQREFVMDYAKSHPKTEILSETRGDHLLAETPNHWAEQQTFPPDPSDPSAGRILNLQKSSWRELFPEAKPPPKLSRVSPAAAAAAAAAPAPAQPSHGVALLRRKMAVVKGQPNLLGTLETIVKATEKRRRRAEKGGASSSTQQTNLNMVFYGPPGTGKTSTVKVLAEVFAAQEVGLLESSKVTELNKETDLDALIGRGSTKLNLAQKVGKLFEQTQGATLFLDEVHQRGQAFAKDLLPLLSKYEGKVMVVIAGYYDDVDNWLRTSDPGMMSRFPRAGFVTFKSLPIDSLVEIGMATLVKRGYSLHPSAHDTFRRVMRGVCAREPPENARGADNEVDTMTTAHEARDDLDDEDMCITTKDILDACPFAATALQHAPTAADASGEAAAVAAAEQAAAAAAPAAAGEAAAGGAPRRSSTASSRTSSTPAGPSSAGAPAAATSGSEETPSGSEEAPRLGPAPSKSAVPASSGKRKRGEAQSGEARAEVELPAVSHEASCLAQVIVQRYDLDKNAVRMTALALVKDMAGRVPEALGAKLDGITRVARNMRTLLKEAVDAINKGKDGIVRLIIENETWYVDGLRLKK